MVRLIAACRPVKRSVDDGTPLDEKKAGLHRGLLDSDPPQAEHESLTREFEWLPIGTHDAVGTR